MSSLEEISSQASFRASGVVSSTPQLRELDEMGSTVYTLVEPHLDNLFEKLSNNAKGVSLQQLTSFLLPFLTEESVSLHRLLSSSQCASLVLEKLFAECAHGSRLATCVVFDAFAELLTECHRRHIQRLSQRKMAMYDYVISTVETPLNLRSLCRATTVSTDNVVTEKLLVLRDEKKFRVVEVYDKDWSLNGAFSGIVSSAIPGLPTAVAVIPSPYSKIVVSFAASNGASMGFFDSFTGALAFEAPILSHQTAMQWMPRLSRLVCGSSLGEISVWAPNGKCDPAVFQAHNGPVVLLGHLSIANALLSVGTDGKIALIEPISVTEIRTVLATEEHITCAAFHEDLNVVAVGGASPHALLWNASLPTSGRGRPLRDKQSPHAHIIVSMMTMGDQLLSLDASGLIHFWDLRTLRCVQSLAPPLGPEMRITSVFSALLATDALGGKALVASSRCVLEIEPSDRRNATFVAKADTLPIVFVEVLRGSHLVTATTRAVRLWSTRTGELHGTCDVASFQRTISDISALAVSDSLNFVFVGHLDGTVTQCDVSCMLSGEMTTAACTIVTVNSHRICCLACCDRMLLIGQAALVSVTDAQMFPKGTVVAVDGIEGALAVEVFADQEGIAVISPSGYLYVIEPSTDHPGHVEDFREYDVGPSYRSGVPSPAFCFFGSLATIAVADGGDISIIALSTAKSRRLLSFPSVSSKVSCLAFECSSNKSILVTVEDDGTVAVYNVSDVIAALSKGKKDTMFIDMATAPQLHVSYCMGRSTMQSLAPSLSACISGADCRCAVYRFDGVKIGDLDMYRSGGGGGWIATASKAHRGSNIVFRVNANVNNGSPEAQRSKHAVKMRNHPTVVGAKTIANRSSPTPTKDDDLPIEASRPALLLTADPIAELPFKKQLGLYQKKHREPSGENICDRRTFAVRGEKSSRTLEPMDASQFKWTSDTNKKDKIAQRDSKALLSNMRLVTQCLNPGKDVVDMASRLMRSPPPQNDATGNTSPHSKLRGMLAKPQTPLITRGIKLAPLPLQPEPKPLEGEVYFGNVENFFRL